MESRQVKHEVLYRGVSIGMYTRTKGELVPKRTNEKFSSEVHFGAPHAVFGSGIVFGNSITNEVIRHQRDQMGMQTSGVSTTPHRDRARFYALAGAPAGEGMVYEISVERLMSAGVALYRVADYATKPSVPDDDEYILVASDFGIIPNPTIISVEKVS